MRGACESHCGDHEGPDDPLSCFGALNEGQSLALCPMCSEEVITAALPVGARLAVQQQLIDVLNSTRGRTLVLALAETFAVTRGRETILLDPDLRALAQFIVSELLP